MEAQDIMTRNVVTVGPDATVREIAQLLVDKHVSAAPVVEADGTLLGIVSEGDLVRRPEIAGERRPSWWLAMISDPGDRAADYVKTHAQHAAEIMTKNVATVNEDTSVAEIAQLLESRRIKRVPVLSDGKLVGIVARADLLRALAVRPPAPAPERQDDRAIQEQLQKVLEEQRWESSLLNVVVEDGVVHLWGMVERNETREALKIAAENITGVKSVEVHFTKPPTWA
ncbi:MAG: CBS domain-containing protein [Alphaproteobacteria bacterium]|jgi:CBS-domain-containing membrane protein|nr:CBS domain-containing protein [Alphaproteobacteria bacterium]